MRALYSGGLAAILMVSGCASVPDASRYQQLTAFSAPAPTLDRRAAFRQQFCSLLPATTQSECAEELWLLADEPDPQPPSAPSPPAPLEQLDVIIVGGAFSECLGDASAAWRPALKRLREQGVNIIEVPVSSRSDARFNASVIAVSLSALPASTKRKRILIGYSKGGIDALYFLALYPQLAPGVDALVTVATPVLGSQLADRFAGTYDSLFQHALDKRCAAGNGGVLDSLRTSTQTQFLQSHPLPPSVRLYAVAALPSRERLSTALYPSWALLADDDPLSDGQVRMAEARLQQSVVLGYVNADHWGVALDLEAELGVLGSGSGTGAFPRNALLEAVVRTVAGELHAR